MLSLLNVIFPKSPVASVSRSENNSGSSESLVIGIKLEDYEIFRNTASKARMDALHDILDETKEPSAATLQYFKDASDAYQKVKAVASKQLSEKRSAIPVGLQPAETESVSRDAFVDSETEFTLEFSRMSEALPVDSSMCGAAAPSTCSSKVPAGTAEKR